MYMCRDRASIRKPASISPLSGKSARSSLPVMRNATKRSRPKTTPTTSPNALPKSRVDLAFIRKIGAQKPAGDEKRHEQQQAENYVHATHDVGALG